MNKQLLFLGSLLMVGSLAVKPEEPTFKERQFEKMQLKAAENVDKAITAFLIGSCASQYTKDWRINLITNKINPWNKYVREHHGKGTLLLLVAKLGITCRRMQLLDRYVGPNPFKFIPGLCYFMLLNLSSWVI